MFLVFILPVLIFLFFFLVILVGMKLLKIQNVPKYKLFILAMFLWVINAIITPFLEKSLNNYLANKLLSTMIIGVFGIAVLYLIIKFLLFIETKKAVFFIVYLYICYFIIGLLVFLIQLKLFQSILG